MQLRQVTVNTRKRQLDVTTAGGRSYSFPYARMDPVPESGNLIREAYVDRELANEAVTYVLESGAEGAVHVDHVLEYNEDPRYLQEVLLYKLTIEASRRIDSCGLSRREVMRRLGTSAAQLYRLLDTTNTRKSMSQMVALLRVLGCNVDVIVSDSGKPFG